METELELAARIVAAQWNVEQARQTLQTLRGQKADLIDAKRALARSELALSELYDYASRCNSNRRMQKRRSRKRPAT